MTNPFNTRGFLLKHHTIGDDMPSLAALVGAVEAALQDGIAIEAQDLTGFSGEKLIGALQRLAAIQSSEGCYVEIGVFQGLTLISTAICTKSRVIGIDNFSQFDPTGQNRSIVEHRKRLNHVDNVELIDRDYEDALAELSDILRGDSVSLYFVDGPHDYRSQLVCLEAIKPHLSENAVIVVDDSNYRHVRLANRDFLTFNPEYRLLFEAYTPDHPMNMPESDRQAARAGWWNGVNIIVRGYSDELEASVPSVPRGRALQEHEHWTQSAGSGFVAPEAVSAFTAFVQFRPIRAARALGKLARAWRHTPKEFRGPSLARNTWSADLPTALFNTAIRRCSSTP